MTGSSGHISQVGLGNSAGRGKAVRHISGPTQREVTPREEGDRKGKGAGSSHLPKSLMKREKRVGREKIGANGRETKGGKKGILRVDTNSLTGDRGGAKNKE